MEQLPKEAESWAQHQWQLQCQPPAEASRGGACFPLGIWFNIIITPPNAIGIVAITWCAAATVSMATNKVKKQTRKPTTYPDVTSWNAESSAWLWKNKGCLGFFLSCLHFALSVSSHCLWCYVKYLSFYFCAGTVVYKTTERSACSNLPVLLLQ